MCHSQSPLRAQMEETRPDCCRVTPVTVTLFSIPSLYLPLIFVFGIFWLVWISLSRPGEGARNALNCIRKYLERGAGGPPNYVVCDGGLSGQEVGVSVETAAQPGCKEGTETPRGGRRSGDSASVSKKEAAALCCMRKYGVNLLFPVRQKLFLSELACRTCLFIRSQRCSSTASFLFRG